MNEGRHMQKIPLKSTDHSNEIPIVKDIEPLRETQVTVDLPKIVLFIAIIGFGVFTGFVLAKTNSKQTSKGGTQSQTQAKGVDAKKMVGRKDEKNFPDTAEGILREGGINNEGTHHIERPGGPSQFVYLTSSVVALDEYNDKKVRVGGQTLRSERVGWLMDVGWLELLE